MINKLSILVLVSLHTIFFNLAIYSIKKVSFEPMKLHDLISMQTLTSLSFFALSFVISLYLYYALAISTIVPILISINLLFPVIVGIFIFNETIGIIKILGLIFVFAGCFLLIWRAQ
jgi:drug/metabolite transporter (DMT)-like permease